MFNVTIFWSRVLVVYKQKVKIDWGLMVDHVKDRLRDRDMTI
jgi:hypothetical protein